MRKKLVIPFAVLALMFSACTSSQPETVAQTTVNEPVKQDSAECNNNKLDINWNENDVVAVAYLGSYASFTVFKADARYSEYEKQFPVLADMKAFTVDAQGYESYLIVPKDKNSKVVVNEYNMQMASKEKPEDSGAVYYESNSGEPILVKGNISEVCPNTKIIITDANGKSFKFHPHLSGENGRLQSTEGVLDFSPEAAFKVVGSPM